MPHANEVRTNTRDRIIRAAIDLIEETGKTGFSMQDLALRAGVSRATPFNLFGSKGHIFSCLFSDDLQRYHDAIMAYPARDAIDRLFGSAKLIERIFRERESYYRPLFTEFYGVASKELRHKHLTPRRDIFAVVVNAAQDEGSLRPDLCHAAISRPLNNILKALVLDWAGGGIDLDRMRSEMCFGLSLVLLGCATPIARSRLNAEMERFGAELTSLRAEGARRYAAC